MQGWEADTLRQRRPFSSQGRGNNPPMVELNTALWARAGHSSLSEEEVTGQVLALALHCKQLAQVRLLLVGLLSPLSPRLWVPACVNAFQRGKVHTLSSKAALSPRFQMQQSHVIPAIVYTTSINAPVSKATARACHARHILKQFPLNRVTC